MQLIIQSLESSDQAKNISGRLGIELDSYLEICQAAIAHNDQVKQRQDTRYYYREIGGAAGGAIKKADASMGRSDKS